MKLEGIWKGEEYHPARGIRDGIPYRIVQEGKRFLLEWVTIVLGVGMTSRPVGFFGDGWNGVYSWDSDTHGDPLPPPK